MGVGWGKGWLDQVVGQRVGRVVGQTLRHGFGQGGGRAQRGLCPAADSLAYIRRNSSNLANLFLRFTNLLFSSPRSGREKNFYINWTHTVPSAFDILGRYHSTVPTATLKWVLSTLVLISSLVFQCNLHKTTAGIVIC